LKQRSNAPMWLVLTWRLSAASSTGRVATWRSLRRLGAVTLTPGAVIVPYTEQVLEQLEWIAEDIVQREGDAYVLPVTELSEPEEELIRRRMSTERHDEYRELREAAEVLAKRLAKVDPQAHEPLERFQFERELAALQRRFANAVGRDYFASSHRSQAKRAIEQARSAGASLQTGPPDEATGTTRRVRRRPRTGPESLRR
jgi:hypothetical protein